MVQPPRRERKDNKEHNGMHVLNSTAVQQCSSAASLLSLLLCVRKSTVCLCHTFHLKNAVVERAGFALRYRKELYTLATRVSGLCSTCLPHVGGGSGGGQLVMYPVAQHKRTEEQSSFVDESKMTYGLADRFRVGPYFVNLCFVRKT